MHIRLLAVLVAVLASMPAAAQPAQTYRSDAGYTLQLPEDWRRLTEDELSAVQRNGSGMGAGMTFEAAFDLSNAPFPAPPLVAVARMELGREVTPEEFEAEFTRPDIQEEVQAGMNSAGAVRHRARANVPEWDDASGAAWVHIALKSDGASPEWALAGFTLAPSGRAMVAVMYFGAPHSDPARARAALEAVVRSMRPA
ncbi:MAG TPA: hypothetical protein VHG08_14085 [Longimicrobium sp.]|nr:hypothetical protein [Longimicrobium sp.]